MSDGSFQVKFWGVRGTVPAPGPSTVRYGGNTSCVEVKCGERILIFDAGTGIRELGNRLSGNGKTHKIDLFLSHCHYDHIEGLPFFSPLYREEWDICIWSGHRHGKQTTEELVATYMVRPYFPIGADFFTSNLDYHDIVPGNDLDMGDGIIIRTAWLNHPDGATGYRIEYKGKSVCYVTDTEHRPGKPDQNILDLIKGADIMIYDSTYCDSEFDEYIGYGHSTWQEGIRLSEAAGVKCCVAFHHLPRHDDDELDAVAREMKRITSIGMLAKEGLILEP